MNSNSRRIGMKASTRDSTSRSTTNSPARTSTGSNSSSPAASRAERASSSLLRDRTPRSTAVSSSRSGEKQQSTAVSSTKSTEKQQSTAVSSTKSTEKQQSTAVSRVKANEQQHSPAVSRSKFGDQKQSPALSRIKATDRDQSPGVSRSKTSGQQRTPPVSRTKSLDQPQTAKPKPTSTKSNTPSSPQGISVRKTSSPASTSATRSTNGKNGVTSVRKTSAPAVCAGSGSSSSKTTSPSATTNTSEVLDTSVVLTEENVSVPKENASASEDRFPEVTTPKENYTTERKHDGGDDNSAPRCPETCQQLSPEERKTASTENENESSEISVCGGVVKEGHVHIVRPQNNSFPPRESKASEAATTTTTDPDVAEHEMRPQRHMSPTRPKRSPVPIPSPQHPKVSSLDEISADSLSHLRQIWTSGGGGILATSPRSKDSTSPQRRRHSVSTPADGKGSEVTNESAAEDGAGGEEEDSEDGEEGEEEVTYFRDRRPSAVYFTPEKAEGYPWLTWNSVIHPDQIELHPSPQQRLEATQDQNYILNLILTIGDVIGQGQYGKVHVASLRSDKASVCDQLFALKKLAKAGQETTVHALAEQRALEVGRGCPFIVRLYACFQTKLAFYLVLELAEGGRLTDVLTRVGRLPEPNVRFYAAQLFCAVAFLHENNILHRDLKLDNVLLDSTGYLRLCDFGLSMDEFRDDDEVASPCGTLFYVAPEVLRGESYGKSADWWSFGVLLYRMATGLLPFNGKNIQELYVAVTRKEPFFDSFLSPSLVSLLHKLLNKMPDLRPGHSAEDRQTLKDDAFFTGLDWEALHARSIVPPELPSWSLFPTVETDAHRVESDSVLSASLPLHDLLDKTPADRNLGHPKQTRSRSLVPCGLLPLRAADEPS